MDPKNTSGQSVGGHSRRGPRSGASTGIMSALMSQVRGARGSVERRRRRASSGAGSGLRKSIGNRSGVPTRGELEHTILGELQSHSSEVITQCLSEINTCLTGRVSQVEDSKLLHVFSSLSNALVLPRGGIVDSEEYNQEVTNSLLGFLFGEPQEDLQYSASITALILHIAGMAPACQSDLDQEAQYTQDNRYLPEDVGYKLLVRVFEHVLSLMSLMPCVMLKVKLHIETVDSSSVTILEPERKGSDNLVSIPLRSKGDEDKTFLKALGSIDTTLRATHAYKALYILFGLCMQLQHFNRQKGFTIEYANHWLRGIWHIFPVNGAGSDVQFFTLNRHGLVDECIETDWFNLFATSSEEYKYAVMLSLAVAAVSQASDERENSQEQAADNFYKKRMEHLVHACKQADSSRPMLFMQLAYVAVQEKLPKLSGNRMGFNELQNLLSLPERLFQFITMTKKCAQMCHDTVLSQHRRVVSRRRSSHGGTNLTRSMGHVLDALGIDRRDFFAQLQQRDERERLSSCGASDVDSQSQEETKCDDSDGEDDRQCSEGPGDSSGGSDRVDPCQLTFEYQRTFYAVSNDVVEAFQGDNEAMQAYLTGQAEEVQETDAMALATGGPVCSV